MNPDFILESAERYRAAANRPSLHIRWMVRSDLPEVVPMSQAFGSEWTEEEFLKRLRQRNCIGMVAERGNTIEGFVMYELHPQSLTIVRLESLTEEVQQAMMAKMRYKLHSHRRKHFLWGESGRQRKLKVRTQWLSDDVQALLSNPQSPAGVVADALEENGCVDRWLLNSLRLRSAFASAVLSAVREEVAKIELTPNQGVV